MRPTLSPYPIPSGMGECGFHREFEDGYVNTVVSYTDDRSSWELVRDVPYVSHLVSKGNTQDVHNEVAKFCAGCCRYSRLEEVVSDVVRECVGQSAPRFGVWEEFLADKNWKASCGEPYRSHVQNFEELVKEYGEDYVCSWFEKLEELLLDGDLSSDTFEVTFLCHSKRDKYAPAKILGGRFRSIQGSDLFLLWIMFKYYKWASEAVGSHPDCFTSFTLPELSSKLLKSMGTDCYLGVDFSAFDRSENANVIGLILQGISLLGQVPETIARFVEYSVCYGPCVLPDGAVVERWGGNPSGQFLTSTINTIYHRVVVRCYAVEFRRDFSLSNCGDDGIYGGCREVLEAVREEFPVFVGSVFGIDVKWEQVEGQELVEYPSTHTFLGRMLVQHEDRVWTATVDLPRILVHWYMRPANDSLEKYVERVRGIDVALAGWTLLQYYGYEVPEEFLQFRASLGELGIEGVSAHEAFGLNCAMVL